MAWSDPSLGSSPERFIREAYLMVLARLPSEGELRDHVRAYEPGQERAQLQTARAACVGTGRARTPSDVAPPVPVC